MATSSYTTGTIMPGHAADASAGGRKKDIRYLQSNGKETKVKQTDDKKKTIGIAGIKKGKVEK